MKIYICAQCFLQFGSTVLKTAVELTHFSLVLPPQSPLPEQEAPSVGLMSSFELMSSKDVAYHMTAYDWELFHCVHEV